MTDLDELQSTWHSLGKQNAKWAVLSDKKQWDNEEFFATGRREIKQVLAVLKAHGVVLPRQSRVMDFGSGVGRLSQALGKHFDEVVGVDIAKSMVVEANRLNNMKNVSFKHVTSGDLKAFNDNSFDLVFTDIVFQHMENEYALGYMQDMHRTLKKGGALIFQLPSHPKNTWKGALIKLCRILCLLDCVRVWKCTQSRSSRCYSISLRSAMRLLLLSTTVIITIGMRIFITSVSRGSFLSCPRRRR